jgi:hypothetical protein
MRALAFMLATFGLAGAAFGQTCWSPAPGMTMCPDGFMSMGGMWMRPPPFPQVWIPDAPGGTTRWTQGWRVDPDGTRRETRETFTTMPDGRVTHEVETRVTMPDGRVCVHRGTEPDCR